MASASMKRLWREMSDAARARPDPYRLRGLPRWRRWAETVLCIARAIVRDLLGGELTLRAMSLVYTTLLSLVPLLAIGFSVLKALGAHNRVEPVLAELLEPLGPQGREITTRIVDFVDNIEVGVLGFVGLLLLFYTVISLLQKIEHALNFIWHVPGQRRPLEKVRDYLSAVIIGPVLLIAATGAIASLMSSQLVQSMAEFGPIGQAIALAGPMTSIALIIAAFTFLYIFLPNTRVKIVPALADTVGFVDGQQPKVRTLQGIQKPLAAESLRHHIDQAIFAIGHAGEPLVLLGRIDRTVDEGGSDPFLIKLLHLILH